VQGLLLWPGDREWQVVAACGGGRLKLLALTVEQYIQVRRTVLCCDHPPALLFTSRLIHARHQHTVSLYIHDGAQWGQSAATTQRMLDAANSAASLYDTDKFNLFSNGFPRKLSNAEFSALMVRLCLRHISPPPAMFHPPLTVRPPCTQVLKVGPFHEHYQTLSQRHYARGDITAALIALERGADRHPRWGCGYHAQSTMSARPHPPPRRLLPPQPAHPLPRAY
jgi:hypothetical protein